MVLFSISIIIIVFYFRNMFILILLKVHRCLCHSLLVHFFEMSYNWYNIFSLFYASFWCLPLACLWTCFWLGEWEVIYLWTENTRSSTNYMWQVFCLLHVVAICTCLHFHTKEFFMLIFQRRPHVFLKLITDIFQLTFHCCFYPYFLV